MACSTRMVGTMYRNINKIFDSFKIIGSRSKLIKSSGVTGLLTGIQIPSVGDLQMNLVLGSDVYLSVCNRRCGEGSSPSQ